MIERNDGGTAFPVPGLQNDADFNGMSLRDYFAAKSLPVAWEMHKKDIEGSLYRDHSDGCEKLLEVDAFISYWQTDEEDHAAIAEIAYTIANAMLAARERS